jgi:hypothetical protein
MKKLGKIGCSLDMTKGVSLNARILDDTLKDNKDNPTFEQEQFDGFAIAFMNDLDFLGIAGTADNAAADASFVELAKGWIQVAKESTTANKPTSSALSVSARMAHLVKNLHEDVKGGKAVVYISATDYDSYQLEVAASYPNSGALVNGGIDSFMGYKLRPNVNIQSGEFLATIPQNMVFGISNQIDRNRWYDNETSSLRYKFVVHPDYEFDIHKYVTYMTFVALTISSYATSVAVGATSTRTVQSAAGEGISGVSVSSNDSAVATVSYASSTGIVSITGVSAGETTVTVNDGTSTKDITVTVA